MEVWSKLSVSEFHSTCLTCRCRSTNEIEKDSTLVLVLVFVTNIYQILSQLWRPNSRYIDTIVITIITDIEATYEPIKLLLWIWGIIRDRSGQRGWLTCVVPYFSLAKGFPQLKIRDKLFKTLLKPDCVFTSSISEIKNHMFHMIKYRQLLKYNNSINIHFNNNHNIHLIR